MAPKESFFRFNINKQNAPIEAQNSKSVPPSLDLKKHNCNKKRERKNLCGCWTVVGTKDKKTYQHRKLDCKSWTCPYCGVKKSTKLRFQISKKATELELTRFLTLTVDPKSCTPAQSLDYINKSWAKFRVYLKRKLQKLVSYICIREFQKSGHAHLHILLGCYIPQAWIKGSWMAVGGGSIVDIRQVDVRRVSRYLAKYMTKEMLMDEKHGRRRRYSTSKDIKLNDFKKEGVWKLLKINLEWIHSKSGDQLIAEGIDDNRCLNQFVTMGAVC